MRKIIITLIVLFTNVLLASAQTDSTIAKINKLKTDLTSAANIIQRSNLKTLVNRLNENQDSIIRNQILSQIKEERKDYINAVTNYSSLSTQAKVFAIEFANTAHANDLNNTIAVAESRVAADNAILFKGFVVGFSDIASQLKNAYTLSENLLIFPKGGAKSNLMIDILKYAGIAGGLYGAFVVSKENPEAGIATSGASLSITQLVSTLFKNKESKTIIENVARNAAFTDEVNASVKIASTLVDRVEPLYRVVLARMGDSNYMPTREDLDRYSAILRIRSDFNVINRQLKAKAESLKGIADVTDEGGKQLDKQIKASGDAVAKWEELEPIYRATYDVLNDHLASKSR